MSKYYPTRNDLDTPDKLERVIKDVYSRIYKPSVVVDTKVVPKRIDTHTGKVVEQKK